MILKDELQNNCSGENVVLDCEESTIDCPEVEEDGEDELSNSEVIKDTYLLRKVLDGELEKKVIKIRTKKPELKAMFYVSFLQIVDSLVHKLNLEEFDNMPLNEQTAELKKLFDGMKTLDEKSGPDVAIQINNNSISPEEAKRFDIDV